MSRSFRALSLVALAALFSLIGWHRSQAAKPGGGGGGGGSDPSKISFMSWSSGGGLPQVFVVDAGGGNRRQVTNELDRQHGGNNWSSDGRFLSTQIQYTNTLKVANAATGAYYTFPIAAYPVWSAHRSGSLLLPAELQLLLYHDDSPEGRANLFVRSPDGAPETIEQLTYYDQTTNLVAETATRADAVDPVWLPDGPNNTIRVQYRYEEVDETDPNGDGWPDLVYWELRVLTLETTAWPAVTFLGDDLLAGPAPADGVGDPSSLVWSRQGTQVAFHRSTAARAYAGFWVAPVVFDETGHPLVVWSAAAIVADTGKIPHNPSFSPNGRAIAFSDYAKPNIHYLHVYRINTDNTGLKQVDGGQTGTEALNPQWGP